MNDNVYETISINHPGAGYSTGFNSTNEQPILAEYDVTKNTPLIDRPSNYYLSVIKFDIPLSLVPLVVCKVIPNQGNPDLCQMSIGIKYLGVNYPVNLIYTPNNNLLPPVQNQTRQVITPYYYIYSYENLIRMFNVALASAWTTSGLAAANPTLRAPFFYLDDGTGFIVLVVSSVFTAAGTPPVIFMNESSKNYLSAFEVKSFGYNQPDGYDYQFILNGSLPPAPETEYIIGGTTYYKYSQDFPTLQNWAILRKILITSNALPVNPEFVPSRNDSNANNATMPVISSFTPIINSIGDNNSICYYVPTSQWKLVDLRGNNALNRIDIRIYWEDANNNLYPLYIPIYQQANIEIVFINKKLYKI